jgi:formiminotetrahydrofolate cyclodeaminase
MMFVIKMKKDRTGFDKQFNALSLPVSTDYEKEQIRRICHHVMDHNSNVNHAFDVFVKTMSQQNLRIRIHVI